MSPVSLEAAIPALPPPVEEMPPPSDAEPEQEAVTEQAPCSHPELQGATEGLTEEGHFDTQAPEMNVNLHQVSISADDLLCLCLWLEYWRHHTSHQEEVTCIS